jgi:Zn-dependent protease
MKDNQKIFIKPEVVAPGEEVTEVGRVFDAPLVVKGHTWLPLIQIVVWGAMAHLAGLHRPERSWTQRMAVGALTMPVALGSEWLHNLAHAAAAKLVGHPVDAIRITWGMPLLVYFEINDAELSPQEHITRAVGGPIFNALVLPLWWFVRHLSPPESVGRDVGEVGVWMNTLVLAAGLLPIPGLDGGPILKWSLVAKGRSMAEADEVVRQVNGPLAVGLGLFSVVSFIKKKPLAGGLTAVLAGVAALIFTGKLKETN